jgi:UDP-N-acetylglucosamine 2-epimerase (non-hydrolysing)/GDP/UDP-N,N'-diacetylbacillosamine 2-epimerase (hydrolysing)
MNTPRKIAVLTTSRADYGHLYWVLKDLAANPDIELRLVVTGAHLSAEFGHTVDEITRDGFTVDERVECLLSSDTDIGMAKTIGIATMSLADTFGRLRPDILLLIADRYEMLAPASVAVALRIPIAHIEGGDVSEGAIDDQVRNALTKMSHLHFTPTERARRRVLAMGEEAWRVKCTGAPSLDHLYRRQLFTRAELERDLQLKFDGETIMVAYHPVTLARDTTHEADAVFAALEALGQNIIFCFPNADAGSRALVRRAEEFCARRANSRLFVNLNHLQYWSVLREANALIGNSSSGIMETPSIRKPTVNIGARQRGRERARNVLDAEANTDAIIEQTRRALDPAFLRSLEGMTNPYGDGHAAERIVETLAGAPLGEKLLVKRAVELRDE